MKVTGRRAMAAKAPNRDRSGHRSSSRKLARLAGRPGGQAEGDDPDQKAERHHRPRRRGARGRAVHPNDGRR